MRTPGCRAGGGLAESAHFFAVAAGIICQILVDYARASRSAKRGGVLCRVNFDEAFQNIDGLGHGCYSFYPAP
jgi:hypothetical protein